MGVKQGMGPTQKRGEENERPKKVFLPHFAPTLIKAGRQKSCPGKRRGGKILDSLFSFLFFFAMGKHSEQPFTHRCHYRAIFCAGGQKFFLFCPLVSSFGCGRRRRKSDGCMQREKLLPRQERRRRRSRLVSCRVRKRGKTILTTFV